MVTADETNMQTYMEYPIGGVLVEVGKHRKGQTILEKSMLMGQHWHLQAGMSVHPGLH